MKCPYLPVLTYISLLLQSGSSWTSNFTTAHAANKNSDTNKPDPDVIDLDDEEEIDDEEPTKIMPSSDVSFEFIIYIYSVGVLSVVTDIVQKDC